MHKKDKDIIKSKQTKRQNYGLKYCLTAVNFAIVFACTCVLSLQIKGSVTKYLSFDTKAIISVKRTGDVTFIAFTVCPDFHNAYKRQKLIELGKSFLFVFNREHICGSGP